jgi:hypothetical protein
LERLQADVHAGARPPEALEQTLQEATADPALRVGYRLPGETEYMDQHGRPCGFSLSKSALRQDQGAILGIDMAGDRIALIVSSRPVLGWSAEIATRVGFPQRAGTPPAGDCASFAGSRG